MEFRQLIFFKKVAEWEHVTKAAEELDTSQPFLSKTISDLEEELGVSLFDHKGRNISLNEYGRIFYQKVCCSLQEIEDGKRQIQDLHTKSDLQIKVATNGSLFLPGILSKFKQLYPSINIIHISSDIEHMPNMLNSNEVDFVISSPALEKNNNFENHILLHDSLDIIYPKNHWLSKRNSITLPELEDECFIASAPGFSIRSQIDRFFKEAGVKPNYIIQSADTYHIPDYVYMGLGIAFLPRFFLQCNPLLQQQNIEVSCPVCEAELNLAWKKNSYFNNTHQIFYDFITDYFIKTHGYPGALLSSHALLL